MRDLAHRWGTTIISSWLTHVCGTQVIVGVQVIEEDVIVTFVEPKNELVPVCQLVLQGELSPNKTTKIASVYLVCD
jgi:hypothetical protein